MNLCPSHRIPGVGYRRWIDEQCHLPAMRGQDGRHHFELRAVPVIGCQDDGAFGNRSPLAASKVHPVLQRDDIAFQTLNQAEVSPEQRSPHGHAVRCCVGKTVIGQYRQALDGGIRLWRPSMDHGREARRSDAQGRVPSADESLHRGWRRKGTRMRWYMAYPSRCLSAINESRSAAAPVRAISHYRSSMPRPCAGSNDELPTWQRC